MERWRAQGKVASRDIDWDGLFRRLTQHLGSPWAVGRAAGIAPDTIALWIQRPPRRPKGKNAGALYHLAKKHHLETA